MMLNAIQLQRLSLATSALLALVVGYLFLNTLSQWHSDWQLAHPSERLMMPTSTSEMTALVGSIPTNHLFGKALSGGNIPITNLQLRVTGIVKTNSEAGNNDSKAYISSQGQPSKIYQKGDSLPYGVKVYDITTDAVVLENDGQLEKLPLARTPLEFKPPMTEEDFK